MFDINGGEFLVLAVVGLVVIGPERLPRYAAELGRMVREVRSFARNAREQVRAEMGEDFDDVDWEKLDPRRYDPRRIVRDALLDDDDDPPPARDRVSDRAPHVPAAMRPDDEPDRSADPQRSAANGASSGATAYDVDAT